MSAEQLTGLQLAVKLLAQIGDDESDRAIAAVHAACDLAQRVADLEAERDALAQQHRSQHDADSAELRQLCADRDAARKERDALLEAEHRISSAYVDLRAILGAMSPPSTDWPVLSQYVATVASDVVNERDALREKYDELLLALHGIGKALGIPEGDRSPYSVTCGALERVNRLAEIEAQEPVAPTVVPDKPSQTFGMSMAQRILHVGGRNNSAGYVEFGGVQAVEALVRQALRDAKLNYARAATAQAVPDADAAIDAAMAAAPEHKA